MYIRLPRSRKRYLVFSILVLLLLILSITIPFLVSSSKTSESPVNFIPLQNVYHQLYGRESQKISEPVQNHQSDHYESNHHYLTANPTLNQIYISVKTTQKYHYPRLIILLETWASLVKEQTWFFTDSSSNSTDTDLTDRMGEHLVLTNCSSSHHRLSLCCKMEQE